MQTKVGTLQLFFRPKNSCWVMSEFGKEENAARFYLTQRKKSVKCLKIFLWRQKQGFSHPFLNSGRSLVKNLPRSLVDEHYQRWSHHGTIEHSYNKRV